MKKSEERKLVYVETDKLIPYANNAKVHGDVDVDAVMASIKRFGFTNPILTWKGIVAAGHGRLLAAKRLGLEKVPTIPLDYMTDEERRAYILADNRIAELSGWDFNVQSAELAEISEIDMSEFGFDDADMEFAEFLGDGDGGKSVMMDGAKLRLVIGAFMCDVKEDSKELYKISRNLDEEKVKAFISNALKNGDLS